MRQLPALLSVNADPTKLAKSLKDEEGDLVTPMQQKLLKRIWSQVTPKREPVPTPRKVPKREPVTPPPTLPIKIPKKQPTTVPEKVLWSELPFAEEGPEPDLEGALKKTLRKMRKTPQYLKQRYQPKGGQVGIHQEKSRKNQRVLFGALSLNP